MAAGNQGAEKGLLRILAAVNDLFFVGKITAAARRTGVPVEFVRGESEVIRKTADSPATMKSARSASSQPPPRA